MKKAKSKTRSKQKANPKKHVITVAEIKKLQRTALELYAEDEGNAKELGRALLAVKTALKGTGKGAFEKWWKSYKLSQSRVSYCLRLAAGKVKPAFKKPRTPERIAVSVIKKNVDEFLKFFAHESKASTVDAVHPRLSQLVFRMIGGMAKMRHWPLVGSNDQRALAAKRQLEIAIQELVEAAFVTVELGELDKVTRNQFGHPGPLSAYLPKKPIATAPIESVAAAASGD